MNEKRKERKNQRTLRNLAGAAWVVGAPPTHGRSMDVQKFLVRYNAIVSPCHAHARDLCLNPGLTHGRRSQHRPLPPGRGPGSRERATTRRRIASYGCPRGSWIRARRGGRGTGTSTRRACSWRASPPRQRAAEPGLATARRTARTARRTSWAPARPCTGCTRSTCRGSSAGSTPAAPSPPGPAPRRPAHRHTPRYTVHQHQKHKARMRDRSARTARARTCRGEERGV